MAKNTTAAPQPDDKTSQREEYGKAMLADADKKVYVPQMERDFNFADLAKAEDELQEVQAQQGIIQKDKWWVRLGDRYFEKRENRVKHLVNRKKYIWLCLLTGIVGGHRYYEKRYALGIIYTLLAITGLPIAFSIVDWMVAVPMKPDENGNILI